VSRNNDQYFLGIFRRVCRIWIPSRTLFARSVLSDVRFSPTVSEARQFPRTVNDAVASASAPDLEARPSIPHAQAFKLRCRLRVDHCLDPGLAARCYLRATDSSREVQNHYRPLE
jgi:hypothetical protein